MAAATQGRKTAKKVTGTHSYPIAASTTIYAGTMVALNASGYLVPVTTTTGLRGVGMAMTRGGLDRWDNSTGAAAAFRVEVEEGLFAFGNGDSIGLGDEGKPLYGTDDQTVAKSSSAGTKSPVGRARFEEGVLYVEMSLLISKQIAEADADDAEILPTATELTIAAGVVTITQAAHTIDTEADAASDDLDTISGGTADQVIYLRASNAARTVVLKHNTGNLFLPYGKDISLAESTDQVQLYYNGAKWTVVGFGVLASYGGAWTQTYATANRTVAAATAVAITDNTTGATTATFAAGVGVFTIPIHITLAQIAGAGDVLTNYTPGYKFKLLSVSAAVDKVVTTGAKAASLNLEIGAVDVTGGVVALTSANCTPLGALVAGSAITAANTGSSSDTISIEAASVTAFVEGEVILLIKIQNMDIADAIAGLVTYANAMIADDLDNRQSVNAIIDDLQAAGGAT